LRKTLKSITHCDKLNIAALGNQVPQLHVHVIARRHTDAAWPKPVWGVAPRLPYEKAQQQAFLEAVRQSLKPVGLTAMDR
jgi:diadenosine tetraphosphate (Ap4A) HIT family hydrolase